MYYYFSLILAISLSIFNSPKVKLYPDWSNVKTLDKVHLVAEVTSPDADGFLVEESEDNSLGASVDSETGNANKNLSLVAIAVTSIFTATLLFLLWQKEPINLSDTKSEDEEKDTLDDKNRLEIPDSSQNGSKINQSSQQQDPQDQDTVIVPPQINSVPQQQDPQDQDTVVVPPQINSVPQQQDPQDQDTVIVPPQINSAQTDVVTELILKLQSKDPQIRPKLIGQLGQYGDSRAMKPLVELIPEVDSQERTLILEAMNQINSSMLKSMNQLLLLSLGDENSPVKLNAIRDLTRIYEVMMQVTERLTQTINNSEQQLPETTQWALKQLKQIPGTPT